MADTENMIVHWMRKIDEKLDRVADDVRDLKTRVTAIEEGMAGVHRRLDRVDERLDRVERRLELVGAG